MTLSSQTTKRLLHELNSTRTHLPSPTLHSLSPDSETSLLNWTAILKGPQNTPYAHGLWKLSLQIKDGYPHTPPDVRFVTKCCHANVNFKTGEICLDLLNTAWTPAYTLETLLESIQQLLAMPDADSPLNVEVGNLTRQGDLLAVEGLVRFYCDDQRSNA